MGARMEYRFMKLMKLKINWEIYDVFYFSGKKLFFLYL
jgi:hypothetical protein